MVVRLPGYLYANSGKKNYSSTIWFCICIYIYNEHIDSVPLVCDRDHLSYEIA